MEVSAILSSKEKKNNINVSDVNTFENEEGIFF